MGGKSSKGVVINKPEERSQSVSPPYNGPSAMYHFVNCEVAIRHQLNLSSTSILTSNIDAYYPTLAENHARGLKLLTFYHVRGLKRPGKGLFNLEMLLSYQGIFCSYPSLEGWRKDNGSSTQYELRVEKSVIQPQFAKSSFLSTGVATDTNHLHQTLSRYADSGSRLICIEITGEEALEPSFFGTKLPALGCDLFFDVPVGGEAPERYIYTCVYVPVHVTSTECHITCQCNWTETFAAHLNQGWRLVEIFYDEANHYQQSSLITTTGTLNSQWFFEKPASRANDPTPMYEGTLVEHEIHIRGYQITTNWEPVIQEMGNKGWETRDGNWHVFLRLLSSGFQLVL